MCDHVVYVRGERVDVFPDNGDEDVQQAEAGLALVREGLARLAKSREIATARANAAGHLAAATENGRRCEQDGTLMGLTLDPKRCVEKRHARKAKEAADRVDIKCAAAADLIQAISSGAPKNEDDEQDDDDDDDEQQEEQQDEGGRKRKRTTDKTTGVKNENDARIQAIVEEMDKRDPHKLLEALYIPKNGQKTVKNFARVKNSEKNLPLKKNMEGAAINASVAKAAVDRVDAAAKYAQDGDRDVKIPIALIAADGTLADCADQDGTTTLRLRCKIDQNGKQKPGKCLIFPNKKQRENVERAVGKNKVVYALFARKAPKYAWILAPAKIVGENEFGPEFGPKALIVIDNKNKCLAEKIAKIVIGDQLTKKIFKGQE